MLLHQRPTLLLYCTDKLNGVGNLLLETNELCEWRSEEGKVEKAVLVLLWEFGDGKSISKASGKSAEKRSKNYH